MSGSIQSYCKTYNVPITAVKCSPNFDEKKGRVSKGNALCHTGWKDKSHYNADHATITPFTDNTPATMWMIYLEPLRFFVIDIDVKGNKKAKDVLKPEQYDNFYNSSSYVVETGSGGLHFYYKLPEDFKGKQRDFVGILNDFFKEGETGGVDIIMKAVITEKSAYSHEGKRYSYTALKGSIQDVSIPTSFDFIALYNGFVAEDVIPQNNSKNNREDPNKEEVIEHLDNIPNDTLNWEQWERMGQLIFNILGKGEYGVFRDWSAKNPYHDERATYKLWCGLRLNTDNNRKPLTMGTLCHLSNKANADTYQKIRNKYHINSDDFWNLIKRPTHYATATFFANYKPYAYIYKTGYGWYSLLKNNTWFFSNSKPDYLINDIAHTFKNLCNVKKNEIDLTSDSDAEKAKLKQLVRFNTLSETLSFCEAVGAFLQNFYLDNEILTKMDENKHLFAFSDKVCDLDTGEVRDIEPTDYISIHTGYPYPTKRYPKENAMIQKFLNDIFEDNGLVEFEMDKMAYALHGNKKLEKFVVETGNGRNGKGTKSKLIRSAFGNYFISIPATVLTKPNDKKDTPNPALVPCRGRRYIEATEPEKGEKLQVGFIKELTGLDTITCRELFGKNIQFVIQGLLSVQCNGVPKWSKPDEAIDKRTIIQPFPFMFVDKNVVVLEANQRRGDPDLKTKLHTNECRDEYIQMLLDRYKIFKDKNVLLLPDAVKSRTDQNRDENITIKEWADETIEKGDFLLPNADVWKRYMDDMGNSAVNKNVFSEQMDMLGYKKKKTKVGFIWTNVVLKKEREMVEDWVDKNTEKKEYSLKNDDVWNRYMCDVEDRLVSSSLFVKLMVFFGFTNELDEDKNIVWTNVVLKKEKCKIKKLSSEEGM